ncbi:tripartite tricarboxylate transporter substrate binding protein [Aquincola sp. S2]|uniref:Tripartite tricarboxylate transporter substrate binding protein n=1 Tax=Pseudaquabacterium terrae TaxID=2732868 RepID=A0ABX2ETZ5_9BURK|nr:tripartite tricarboxylate transporter substrate binding protein [Aquabacterium terrae]NRF71977.1 tripartite tricarboxylate transporter substrate binding protein [Aquabacterium terrae]
MLTRRPLLGLGLAAALTCTAASVQAQAWPTKPVRLIVPYAAGGPTDVVARLVAKKVETAIGQPVIVDNKAGAGGTIGVDAALKAPADGYTFALAAPGPLAGMPNLMKVPYALADVQYLTLVARIPAVIVVRADAGIASLPDLVKKAKAAPGTLNYGSAGPGTSPHIGAELLRQEAGIELTHVPYKGAAPAVTALLGGEIQMVMVDLLPVMQHVAAGKLKILAVASASRAPQAPDVPTTKEAGYPGVLMDTTYGVIGAPGVPAEVQKRFRDAVVAAVSAPDMKEQLLKQGAVPVTSTPQEYKGLMQAEFEKWKAVVTKGKITLE